MLLRLFLFVAIVFLTEYYFYQSLKNILPSRFHSKIFIAEWIWLALLVFVFVLMIFYRPHQWHDVFRVMLSLVLIVEISKLFGAVFALADDVRRLFLFVYAKSHLLARESRQTGISRSEFFSQLTMLFTFMPFAGFIYGMIKGAYRYQIHEVRLLFPEFPKNMGALKVVQISDLHLGSFFSDQPVEKVVELVNAEMPDIIVFTGDLVNNVVEEALPYKDILSKLKAGIGVFSILGNHDYGDYVQWNSLEDKKKNLERLVNFQRELGWDILMNENRVIEKNGEKIVIIGVENWGGNLHFPRYGKLDVAYKGVENVPFKILLSHDPSHWDLEVSKKYSDIQLTLSGHTHGFQFGIEYGNIKFSPVQWVYKHWAGLYWAESKNNQGNGKQYLYVNRGAGFIGYPGRLGIWPEITVIEIVHG
ncbi:MAG: phosphoesterase [Bacteroidia bacterium]|nr:MAG: phosphoesterase [Bacteroidia bacterium]